MRELSPNEYHVPLLPTAQAEALLGNVTVNNPLAEQTLLIDPETAVRLRTRRRVREQNAAQLIQPAAQPSSRQNKHALR